MSYVTRTPQKPFDRVSVVVGGKEIWIDIGEDALEKCHATIRKHFPKRDIGYYAHQHPLILCEDTFTFKCTECPDFCLHKSSESPKQIFYPLHSQHPLNSFDHSSSIVRLFCSLCSLKIRGHAYGCNECEFNIHAQCAQLPLQIQHHPLHPPHDDHFHSLSLSIGFREPCSACRGQCVDFAYVCGTESCKFKLHVYCIPLMPNIDAGKNNHIHKLTLFNKVVDILTYCSSLGGSMVCDTCKSSINVFPFARCVQCDLTYHAHCVLPLKIKTKHHIHSIMINPSNLKPDYHDDDGHEDEEFYCDACEVLRDPNDTTYSCLECHEYVAHVACAFSQLVRILEEDPLFMVELEDEAQFDPLEAKAIKAAKKVISEALQNGDNNEKECSGDEEGDKGDEKDELIGGYYGAENIYEEDSSTDEEYHGHTDQTLFEEMLDFLTEDELKEILHVLEVEEPKILVDAREIFLKDYNYQENNGENDEEQYYSLYSDVTFKRFLKLLDTRTQTQSVSLVMTFKRLLKCHTIKTQSPNFDPSKTPFQREYVRVGNYTIPANLTPTLRALLANYGDIGASSPLSINSKMCVIILVCETINSMDDDEFLTIKESFFGWLDCLKLAQCTGFQVQFAFDRLKRLLRAQFGVHVKAFSNHAIAQIDKKIKNLCRELEELEEICGSHRAFTKGQCYCEKLLT